MTTGNDTYVCGGAPFEMRCLNTGTDTVTEDDSGSLGKAALVARLAVLVRERRIVDYVDTLSETVRPDRRKRPNQTIENRSAERRFFIPTGMVDQVPDQAPVTKVRALPRRRVPIEIPARFPGELSIGNDLLGNIVHVLESRMHNPKDRCIKFETRRQQRLRPIVHTRPRVAPTKGVQAVIWQNPCRFFKNP